MSRNSAEILHFTGTIFHLAHPWAECLSWPRGTCPRHPSAPLWTESTVSPGGGASGAPQCSTVECFEDFKVLFLLFIFMIILSHLSFHISQLTQAHRSRRGPRFDLSSQRKFEEYMKIWCYSFHKMHKRKKSTEGTTLLKIGFLAIFGKNRLKNQFNGIFVWDSSYWCKIRSESQILVKYVAYFGK